MNWKFWQRKDKPFIVLDAGTEAFKSIIAEKSGGKVVILSQALTYPSDLRIENFKENVSRNLDELFRLFILSKKPDEKANQMRAVILLPPDILHARVSEVEIGRTNPKSKISESERKFMLSEAVEKAKERVLFKFTREYGILPGDLEWSSFKFLEFRIDGYEVEDIRRYRGSKLNFKVLSVFALKHNIDIVKKAFTDLNLHVERIIHLSEPVSEVLPQAGEGIILDVGGRSTQLFFIKNKKLSDFEIIGKGGADFSEIVSENLGLNKEAGRQLKEDYAGRKLTPETAERLKDILSAEKSNWERSIFSLKKDRFQEAFFFIGGGSMLKEARGGLENKAIDIPKILGHNSVEIAQKPQFMPCMMAAIAHND